MGLGTKIVVAAVALGVLSSPAATSSVLGHTHDAITAVRSEASAELDQLTGGAGLHSSTEAARPRGNGDRGYRFTVRDSQGRPGRWNPCQSVDILVNTDHAPAFALRDFKAAVAKVNAASGLRFRVVGTTSARPTSAWGTAQWSGRPGAWAPVLVAFDQPGTANLADDGSSGVTTPVWVTSGSREIFVSGSIVFNSEQNRLYRPGFGTGLRRGELFEHELGHLAGLEHVADRNQIMYAEVGHATTFGRGDRTGLRALGAGGCIDTPAPAWAN